MAEENKLGFFEKYLTVWIFACIVIGIALGKLFPQIAGTLDSMQVYEVSIPIAICLFFMIYPIMVQIDFKQVVKAGKTPKPVLTTLVINWVVKPFTMLFFAWLFMANIFAPYLTELQISQYIAGMILLGVAPCTAMVLVWGYLAKGNQGHTLVMVAINSLVMLFLYAPLARILLGISDIVVPWETILLSVSMYVGVPLVAGYFSRNYLLENKGKDWFENRFSPVMHNIAITALLVTLVALFSLQGDVILDMPLVIAMIAVPLLVQVFFIFFLGYGIAKAIGISYEDAAPTALIGASNHFEVAIAVAAMLFGINSGAALATVVGVLIEVPVMLGLVSICLRTKKFFKREA
ncbi:ACR3 family arsenite efflux transporter [Methanococcoides methylutens]|uniref:Arsenical-resistance protein ACR3 n=1 Tax=Methanococcoides methylutens MM1 TaxID=1434104 RepID=A0A0E3X049_METMT|nr:ACR3 family arsenite efflux transporter [Methanococcoides methylutens]AKB85500.1 Arsenical-resistance protein ACR3 [Methanococcoides methylutens MM1]